MVITRIALALSALILAAPMAWAADIIDLNIGYSHVVRPSAVPGTVIVGDDAIADATIGGGNTVILTGKALGSTNLIILDEAGQEILSTPVTVAPVDRRRESTIRIVKGGSTEQDYVCGPGRGCSQVKSSGAAAAPTLVESDIAEPQTEAADSADQSAAAEPDSPNP